MSIASEIKVKVFSHNEPIVKKKMVITTEEPVSINESVVPGQASF